MQAKTLLIPINYIDRWCVAQITMGSQVMFNVCVTNLFYSMLENFGCIKMHNLCSILNFLLGASRPDLRLIPLRQRKTRKLHR